MFILIFVLILVASKYYSNYSNLKESNSVIVSNSDKRQYRNLYLANGLEAALVSDPESKTASAAISVRVGSGSNPPEILGLAHLLEHMLFLGSTKYPDQNQLSKLVSTSGGYDNAYTSDDETNYYFVSGVAEFEEVVDVFSWFFRDPLLDSESIEKEVQNVNSEHRKNLNNDNWRTLEMMKSVADSNSTYHNFATGSTQTLWETPKIKGMDMSDELRKFYKRYYSADIMKLGMTSSHTLDELEEITTRLFSVIPNNATDVAECKYPFSESNLPKEIRFIPSSERSILSLVFPIK